MVSIGLNIINFGPVGNVRNVRDAVLRAEASGFDLAMVSDHVAVTPDVNRSYPAPFLEVFTLLSWLSGATTNIALGTSVVVLPYRHPLLVGAMTDTIERLSGRRLVLGVGAGWAEDEYEALGVDYDSRGRITDDYLGALVAQRQNASGHAGKYACFKDVLSGRFGGDIWIGGSSRAALSRAMRYGQAWHPLGVTLDWLRDTGVPTLRSGDNKTSFAPRLKLLVTPSPTPEKGRKLGHGSWDQIERDLRELVAMQASHIVLDPDVPAVRAGGDPWPLLERAVGILRSCEANIQDPI